MLTASVKVFPALSVCLCVWCGYILSTHNPDCLQFSPHCSSRYGHLYFCAFFPLGQFITTLSVGKELLEPVSHHLVFVLQLSHSSSSCSRTESTIQWLKQRRVVNRQWFCLSKGHQKLPHSHAVDQYSALWCGSGCKCSTSGKTEWISFPLKILCAWKVICSFVS